MTQAEILSLFREREALLDGHFVLRSGLHSRQFFQCAMLLQHPRDAGRICAALADKLAHLEIDTVVSPAMGGILVGHEVARHLGRRHIFLEKENGALVLRRGFTIAPGERILIAEDVVTRGGRVQESIDIVRAHSGDVRGVGVIVDRSGGVRPEFGCEFVSLLELAVETFAANEVPEDLTSIPAIHPGSK